MNAETITPVFDPFAGPVIVDTAQSTEPQREIWTASALGEDASLAFNESITVRLHGELELDLLQLALSDLVARHEALRMTLSGDGLTLCVSAPFAAEVTRHDLTPLPAAAQEASLVELARREVETPFELTAGPLFRAHFLSFGPGEHALVFTAHHIVCDGWSTAVLVRDWAKLYDARRKAAPADLPPAESFMAYARTRAEAGAGRADESYWLSQFSGEIPVLDLPSDRPRPPRKTYRSERQDLVLPAELVSAVRKAGAKARASLFATLLAGFKALVFRLTGQNQLVIGIPSAGQASEGHSELVGHCVNMLPLRSEAQASEPFTDFLARVRKTLLDAQEHQDFTFGTLLSRLPILRDPSRLPLVSVIFNVDRGMTSDAIGFEGIRADLKGNPRRYENFDLFLNAVEIDGRIELECQHNADLFDAATVQRWLASYGELLGHFASKPDTALGELQLASEAERAQLAAWNATDAEFRRDACVHDLFEERAQSTPEAVACEFAGTTSTYAELDARSNRIAHLLRELGVQRGTLVGVCLERGPDLIAALLAAHKAGAGYVPLDPDYPRERLAYMVEDSKLLVLITHSALNAELSFPVGQVLELDSAAPRLEAVSPEPLPRDALRADPESVAYVIYTSGSTGKPKGVLVPHRAVVNLLNSVSRRPGLRGDDVVLAITTLSFDIAVSEIWLPLAVGAKIVLVSRDVAADGALLREVCERTHVTFIDATPATYRLLLAAGWRGGSHLTLICTGEAMPKDLALELPKLARAVWNGYGPTETTVWSTFWRVPERTERVLIGRPVDNTRIYVLDAQQRPVPLGAHGELYIAGDGVSHGYLNRPELTREKFVPDPFDAPGRLMYRTGDVGRYLNDGELECLGRNDNQVKLRGFRIELGEIEDALGQHPAVAVAAVILREDRPGDARLVGYVVAQGATPPSGSELRAQLKKTLPDYMVPAAFVTLDRMPLTPSGKIDRRALPPPGAPDPQQASEFSAPRTDTERLLAELWSVALNVARVSIHDDFFALGGHSLLASQILARLRREHGIELSFRKFFEAPTVARLAELIDGVPVAERVTTAAIQRRASDVVVPLSLAQERLWLLEEMHPAQRLVHNLPAAWRIVGPLDRALLQNSVDRIAARHETLRMTLAVDGNRATQRIAERVELRIDFVDLRGSSPEEQAARVHQEVRERTAQLFDLQRGPLFRSTLFALKEDEHLYFTVRHNIIWDGWSFDVFLQELCATYDALSAGREPELPVLPVSYGDYVLWQREWVKSPELARQVEFWQKALAGDVPDLNLPLDFERPAQATYAGANLVLSLTRSDAEALTAVAHRANTTLFNVLFAAYCVLLSRFSGQDEVVVGTPVRARNLPEVESLIGPFINAIVLRSKLDQERSFLDYLAEVRDLTLDAFSNQEMPLELLGTRPPIVRAFFSFQDAKSRPMRLGAAQIAQVDVEPPAAANDLMLWMMDRPSELLAVANFNTEVFKPETVQRLLQSFVTLLRDVAARPNQPVGHLSILSEQDRADASAARAPSQATTGAFAQQALCDAAREHAELTAVAQGEKSWSYGELRRRSGVIAAQIAERVAPGNVIAISLPRSPELVSAVFGAFESGSTVMLLDPSAPLAYSKRLLRAGAPLLLLTDDAHQGDFADDGALAVITVREPGPSDLPAPSLEGLDANRHAAWLSVRFDGRGDSVLSRITHADLLARATTLAETVRSARALRISLDPLSEAVPLELVLSCVLRSNALLCATEVSRDESLSALGDEISAAIAPAAAWADYLASNQKPRPDLSAIVYGRGSSGLLGALQDRVGRVVTISVSASLSAMFVDTSRAAHESNVLGKLAGPGVVTVLDRAGNTLPIGAPGRLVLQGHPPLELGLRGRQRADGSFEAMPDPSSLVLASGVRFDLAEVGNALARHKAVSRAVARVEEAQSGAPRLVAYFAHVPGQSFTDTELRRHVRSLLPEALVPQLFVELESLPVTSDGSIDYGKLPLPFGSESGTEYVAPRNDVERRLVEIFSEALRVPRVGVYDNFFDLGGHSLLCFRVIERIEREMGKRLSPRTLLLNSLEQVATELGSAQQKTNVTGPAPAMNAPEPKEDGGARGGMFKRLTGFLKR